MHYGLGIRVDLRAVTDGRLIAVLLMLVGIGAIGILTATAASSFLNRATSIEQPSRPSSRKHGRAMRPT